MKPANHALLSIGDKSKSKQGAPAFSPRTNAAGGREEACGCLILQLSNLLNQFIARCNASILGVRI